MTLHPSEPIKRHVTCADCGIELSEAYQSLGSHLCQVCRDAPLFIGLLTHFTPPPKKRHPNLS